jgi:glycogen synthase kinase 3 beta
VFRKADPHAIDLITRLLEYTPTQRLSAIEAMVHPFFDELRVPGTMLPDSRHPSAPDRVLPPCFNFTKHGKLKMTRMNYLVPMLIHDKELSIRTDLNQQLVPQQVRAELKAQGIDFESPSFVPLTKDEMIARLD